MTTDFRTTLASIRRFDQLIAFLRDEMDWPIVSDDFEELTFEYSAEELGIDAANAAKIQEIKRLRPLAANQPWGVFFVKFEPRAPPRSGLTQHTGPGGAQETRLGQQRGAARLGDGGLAFHLQLR